MRSPSVKGSASCAFASAKGRSGKGGFPAGAEVDLELGWRDFIHGSYPSLAGVSTRATAFLRREGRERDGVVEGWSFGWAQGTRALNLTNLPDFLRERIAQAANVAVTDVKPEHMAQITELNLSHTPMTEAELTSLLQPNYWKLSTSPIASAFRAPKVYLVFRSFRSLACEAALALRMERPLRGSAGFGSWRFFYSTAARAFAAPKDYRLSPRSKPSPCKTASI